MNGQSCIQPEPVERPPVPPVGGGGLTYAEGLVLFSGRVQMYDGCMVTTKNGHQKIEGQLL